MVGLFYLKLTALLVIARLLIALVIFLFPVHLEEAFRLRSSFLMLHHRREPLVSALLVKLLVRRTDLFL